MEYSIVDGNKIVKNPSKKKKELKGHWQGIKWHDLCKRQRVSCPFRELMLVYWIVCQRVGTF